MSLYIIPSNLGYDTRGTIEFNKTSPDGGNRFFPFLIRLIPKSPKWSGVQSYRAVGGGMHTERSERPRGSGGFSEKDPTILIAAIPRLTFRFGAVSCENKKLTSNGEHLFGQIDQSRRSLESLFLCLPACHNYRISSIFMIGRLMPGNYKHIRHFFFVTDTSWGSLPWIFYGFLFAECIRT